MYEVEILRMTLKGKMYEITLHYKYYFNIADRVTDVIYHSNELLLILTIQYYKP